MQSETTDVKRGDGLLMSGSLASRTAAMIDAAITSVEANLSVIRFCSAIALVRSSSSRAMARLISPMYYRRSLTWECFANRSRESRPWKMSAGKYRRLAPQSGQSADPGVRHSPDWCRDVLVTPLAENDKGMYAGRGAVEHEDIIGEYMAKIWSIVSSLFPSHN